MTQDIKVTAFILFYFSIIALSCALFFFSHAGTSCGPGSEKVISRCVNHADNVGVCTYSRILCGLASWLYGWVVVAGWKPSSSSSSSSFSSQSPHHSRDQQDASVSKCPSATHFETKATLLGAGFKPSYPARPLRSCFYETITVNRCDAKKLQRIDGYLPLSLWKAYPQREGCFFGQQSYRRPRLPYQQG